MKDLAYLIHIQICLSLLEIFYLYIHDNNQDNVLGIPNFDMEPLSADDVDIPANHNVQSFEPFG